MSVSWKISMVAVTLLALPAVAPHAGEFRESDRVTRVDVGGYRYSFSQGHALYGPWWGGRVRVANSPAAGSPGATGIFEAVAERRNDPGNPVTGVYLVGSGYYDWNDHLYTYSAIGYGSNENFAHFTAHQELDMKMFSDRSVVVSLGGGYLDYQSGDNTPYISAGSAYYWNDSFDPRRSVILQYQYRRYFSSVNNGQLGTHIFGVSVRSGDAHTLSVRYLRGPEAYTVGGGLVPTTNATLFGRSLSAEYETRIDAKYGFAVGVDFIEKVDQSNDATLYRGPGVRARIIRFL